MIVVDTSVWVDYFRDEATWQVEMLAEAIDQDAGIALTDVVLTEILQGLTTQQTARRVERRLMAFEILRLDSLDDFTRAAAIYRSCRSRGVTIRRTLDCLIASVCIREQRPLLHADRDFDQLATHTALSVVGHA